MTHPPAPERHLPGRLQALAFHLKTRVLQMRRGLREFSTRPPRHPAASRQADAPVIAEVRAPLWRDLSPEEFPLTAGKVENLRQAARAFHGVEIPAGGVFSFWRQLGRTTKSKGFTAGRELREGCLVPAVGGGLCQLSGLLYQAALKAGLEVVERHAHSRDGDRWLTPLDGHRWNKPNYQWSPPPGVKTEHATISTLLRSFRQRRLPAQGALRQRTLLESEAALARSFAAKLDPQCRHLVVSQNLLPHLWKSGALGGRSFDVLIQRWPMAELQRRLDLAKSAHPASTTLGDFRADPDLLRAETEALAAAARLITPHRDLAAHFGERAWKIDWDMPAPLERRPSPQPTVFFPASRLGRKGAFELAAALKEGIGAELRYLGRASEGSADPFAGLPCSPATAADLASAWALVLPAWIEHQPRLALLALASGIPVVATRACGLPEHPLLHILPSPDPAALRTVLRAVVQPAIPACAAC
jgi:hypothetical protein